MISLDDVVSLSRMQFGATAMFHFLFVPLTLGLSWILVIAESAYVMTGKVIYKDITRFWGKLFGINFVMGVTTGITLEFQFGTNWAYYSHYVGDIFGTPLAVEGLMAFFLESTLVGLFFFGWDKLSRGQHLLVTMLVALGSNLSALWILIANGWMQNPVGAEFNPMTMRMELVDVAAVIFNPVAQVKFVHTVAAGYVAASLFVMGVSSWYLLRRMEVRFALRSFAIASGFGLAAILSVIVLGDESGYRTGEVQQVKLAAIEAEWHTEPAPASFTLFGFPDQAAETTHAAVKIPYLMGIIATRSLDEQVTGLKDLKARHEARIRSGMLAHEALEAMRADGNNQAARATFERHRQDLGYGLLLTPYAKEIGKADEAAIAKAVADSIPQVAPLFWSFRLMVGIGVVLLALFAAAFLQLCRGKLVQSPRLLKALFWSIPLPWIAIEAGWFVAEFGRQPWTISDVLPVSASVSLLTPGQLWFSLISICLIYTSLLVVELFLLRHVIRKGPASLQTGRYQGEVLQNGSPA
ncbi:cytochrome ubiquinol oxidase subunit I [Aeromonas hydrophila]|uniref:Cytochrome bd-I ubiquinol oxidase subunit CydA n=1 Tax=Aeromonas hydrophila TaxID=644 RepID=A0AAD3UE19_AERHY|nr:cytochrome ubiquinol oxidase subunit I [Aeromonas hydrophila]AGM43585.1 cytochrome D ubiquinol oxidase subunit I [Aeromonas hydrophila ML09-119]AHX32273.1 cytochrome d terminal oxidase subunit 1 [Aeromonas hydrophila subsp. hydrophila AL09-71]AHX69071.1 cytochrome d terminal oxidase subunit 1 [Aeromonas hydrophila pc104A]AJE36933.1 cytochrome d terminal oxidase subunit 1 [Aeromonas hydrophila J-1]AKJ35195.1 cytochrome d terminal oxidase subunit 1 [Aeromonas hydrophila NJ-35]